MIQVALAAVLVLTSAAQDQEKPSPELVQKAVARIDRAFEKDGTAAQRIEALTAAAEVPDPEVVKAMGKGLKDKELEVVQAAVVGLGRMPVDDALDALHAFYKKNRKKLQDEEQTLTLTFQAIARHGDESSVEILTDKLFSAPFHSVVQARIYGLGMIRSKKSVEGIIAMMTKTSRRNVENYMGDLRLSLVALTGTDQGLSVDGWQLWWQKNRRDFEIPAELKFEKESDLFFWNEYWGLTQKEEEEESGDSK